jgi:hypothetical protein
MLAFAHRGATVNRVKVRSRMDPVTARLRTSWLLDEATLQPPALPPAAILCIRHLRDPRPGTVDLQRTQLPPRGWSDAVAASVARLARHAQHPAHGDGAADAEAVIFADRAEMLACLAADWCAERLTALWWWRALLRDVGDAQVILRAWLESPSYIAAAIEELARRGVAIAFAQRLSAAATHALLDAIVVQHGLRWLVSGLEALTDAGRSSTDVPADSRARERVPPRNHERAIARIPRAPWTEWVPERELDVLRVDQQCLLGIALMTRRAPTLARTVRFAADVQQWCLDARRLEPPSTSTREGLPVGSHDHDPVDPDVTAPRVEILTDDNSIIVSGCVPGADGGLVVVRHAAHPEYEFRTLDAIAAGQNRTPVEQFIQIVKDGGASVVCTQGFNASDVWTWITDLQPVFDIDGQLVNFALKGVISGDIEPPNRTSVATELDSDNQCRVTNFSPSGEFVDFWGITFPSFHNRIVNTDSWVIVGDQSYVATSTVSDFQAAGRTESFRIWRLRLSAQWPPSRSTRQSRCGTYAPSRSIRARARPWRSSASSARGCSKSSRCSSIGVQTCRPCWKIATLRSSSATTRCCLITRSLKGGG